MTDTKKTILDLTRYEGHTPGEWISVPVDGESVTEVYPAIFGGEKNTHLKALIARVARWEGDPQRKSEAAANLSLVTDAPALLSELTDARAVIWAQYEALMNSNGARCGECGRYAVAAIADAHETGCSVPRAISLAARWTEGA